MALAVDACRCRRNRNEVAALLPRYESSQPVRFAVIGGDLDGLPSAIDEALTAHGHPAFIAGKDLWTRGANMGYLTDEEPVVPKQEGRPR